MTARVHRTQWIHRDEPKPEPVDSHMAKARKLPMPGPGIPVTVRLDVLPEYLQLYGLVPNGIREPKMARRDGPGEAILLVTHAPARSAGKRVPLQKGETDADHHG